MKKTIEAKATHRFRASAERVFDAWLDEKSVRHWMALAVGEMGPFDMRRVEIEPRVGGKFTFSDMRKDGEAVHWGTYLEIDRPRRLVFTWFTSKEDEQENHSTVTLTIERDGEGCVATIVHAMDAKWADYQERTANGWGTMFSKIDAHFAAR
jgi:uncharacterized protein YndB with AHSA1/START domain